MIFTDSTMTLSILSKTLVERQEKINIYFWAITWIEAAFLAKFASCYSLTRSTILSDSSCSEATTNVEYWLISSTSKLSVSPVDNLATRSDVNFLKIENMHMVIYYRSFRISDFTDGFFGNVKIIFFSGLVKRFSRSFRNFFSEYSKYLIRI